MHTTAGGEGGGGCRKLISDLVDGIRYAHAVSFGDAECAWPARRKVLSQHGLVVGEPVRSHGAATEVAARCSSVSCARPRCIHGRGPGGGSCQLSPVALLRALCWVAGGWLLSGCWVAGGWLMAVCWVAAVGLLLAAACGCGWSRACYVVGCCRLPQAAAGCCWSLLVHDSDGWRVDDACSLRLSAA